MRLLSKIRFIIQATFIRLRESNYGYLRLHLGTNSVALMTILLVMTYVALQSDVFSWRYLIGIEPGLAFFIGFFSVVFGVSFYKYWRLDRESVYSFHLAKTQLLPKELYVIGDFNDFAFAVGRHAKIHFGELTSVSRRLISIVIFFILALITLDNTGYARLSEAPEGLLQSGVNYCPIEEEVEEAPPKQGCELIIRAYELGYAEDLGECAPEEIDPETLKICEKRRVDEPYLHYASRVVASSVSDWVGLLNPETVDRVRTKFERQLQDIEALRDYQRYAMSSAPRASHHIWTNLPYPANDFVRQYREVLNPGFCIEMFQNQTNTVVVADNDPRKDSKLLEHAFGQLLFNPKSNLSVAFCKEFKVHWESEPDTCARLASDPETVLREFDALEDVGQVLHRHDVASAIIQLENDLAAMQQPPEDAADASGGEAAGEDASEAAAAASAGETVVTPDAASESAPRMRPKNEVVSFQCFMQDGVSASEVTEHNFELQNTPFTARTRLVPEHTGTSESQIAMYDELAKLLEDSFHYSQLSSRSDMDIQGGGQGNRNAAQLEEPTYLFSRLELLKNVDIFLGNNWVLERTDLLGVYPFHVHLQNYVDSFREAYRENRGRL